MDQMTQSGFIYAECEKLLVCRICCGMDEPSPATRRPINKMQPTNQKWICGARSARFLPPTDEHRDALKQLTARTTASHDQIKALRQLGANIPAVVMAGKKEIEV